MKEEEQANSAAAELLTQEQEEVLDLYIQQLDEFYGAIKESEKRQVEIETLHLKRILTK